LPRVAHNYASNASETVLPLGKGVSARVYSVTVVAVLDAHAGSAWRVSWNAHGTTLATSGADSTVRSWRGVRQRRRLQ